MPFFINNGIPVKLKGANRHESRPDTEHYLSGCVFPTVRPSFTILSFLPHSTHHEWQNSTTYDAYVPTAAKCAACTNPNAVRAGYLPRYAAAHHSGGHLLRAALFSARRLPPRRHSVEAPFFPTSTAPSIHNAPAGVFTLETRVLHQTYPRMLTQIQSKLRSSIRSSRKTARQYFAQCSVRL